MVLKIFGYLGIALVAGIMISQIYTTQNLVKVDTGLNSSLRSTRALVTIQQSIIQKNQVLKQVVGTTNMMGQQLSSTLKVTETIDQNIHQIDSLNGSTLKVNQGMVSLSANSKTALAAISKQMDELSAAISALEGNLYDLSQMVKTDEVHMHDMLNETSTMNDKVPGVLR